MDDEFVYWKHLTPPGIRVEEVTGCIGRSGETWRRMALQIYCEHGRDSFREIGHLPCGAPFLEGEMERVSLTHTAGMLAVASLPRTPEADLSRFSPRTALGIDAERADREQVLRVRERFLDGRELAMVPADDLTANIIAWTSKEAMYKAALTAGLDFRRDILIDRMPVPGPPVLVKEATAPPCGTGRMAVDGEMVAMELYTYVSEGCVVTIAFSPKCAKYKNALKK